MSEKNPIFRVIDSTRMTKSYKMVLLLSLLREGDLVQEVPLQHVLRIFRKTYAQYPFSLDIADSYNKDLCRWTDAKLRGFIIRNPITHIIDTPERVFFWEDEVFGIDPYFYVKLDAETRAIDFKCHILRRLEYYFWTKYQYKGLFE